MKTFSKNHNQENFPVASFLSRKENREYILKYYNFARFADDIADSEILVKTEKIMALETLSNIIKGYDLKEYKQFNYAYELKDILINLELSHRYASDLIIAFLDDAKNKEYNTWNELINYCRYSAAPVGKFILALNKQSLSTHFAADALSIALQLINHIQDVKKDLVKLNRFYIPNDYLKEFNVKKEDFLKDESSNKLNLLKNKMLDSVSGLIHDSEKLPKMVTTYRLKLEILFIINLAKKLTKKLRTSDILKNNVKLNKFDWVRIFIKTLLQSIITRRNLAIKDIQKSTSDEINQ